MRDIAGRLERHQVLLCLAALAAGGVLGLLVPSVAGYAEAAITPVLALLLYATFLGVPVRALTAALRDRRFLVTVLVVNVVVVPPVVLALTRIIAHDEALLVGVLLVLLTPCVDYVLVFTGLAGGARERLLAATPLLMLAQMVLLPVVLRVVLGPEVVAAVDLEPFVRAFLVLIVLPLAAAWLTQVLAARGPAGWSRAVRTWTAGVEAAMVPLMMATLLVIVASQIAGVGARFGSLLLVIPVFVLFAAVMVPLGILAGRIARLDVAGTRAVALSGVTRNSLVVLPLALALPARFDLAPLVVVTQTLVELLVLVVLVRLVPRFVPHPARVRGPA